MKNYQAFNQAVKFLHHVSPTVDDVDEAVIRDNTVYMTLSYYEETENISFSIDYLNPVYLKNKIKERNESYKQEIELRMRQDLENKEKYNEVKKKYEKIINHFISIYPDVTYEESALKYKKYNICEISRYGLKFKINHGVQEAKEMALNFKNIVDNGTI